MRLLATTTLIGCLSIAAIGKEVQACDLHGMPGFGFGMMANSSNAPKWQPGMHANQGPQSKLQTNAIKLIGVEKAADVSVKFQITEPFERATITASSDYKLQLLGDSEVNVSEHKGDVTFSISARQAGRYILNLQLITEVGGEQQQKITKQVYVNARTDM